eukprot:SAG11_NODE_9776_length_881_cov_1.476982_1_plen_43_part_10
MPADGLRLTPVDGQCAAPDAAAPAAAARPSQLTRARRSGRTAG